jgi:hypothetical protein
MSHWVRAPSRTGPKPGAAQPAQHDLEVGHLGKVRRGLQQHGDAEMRGELRGGGQRHLRRAQHEAKTLGDDVHGFRRRGGQQGLRQKGGHFGQGRGGVLGPSGPVAQIQGGGGVHPEVGREFGESLRLLAAGDDGIPVAQGGLGDVDLAGAERGAGGADVEVRSGVKSCRVDRLRPQTIACDQCLRRHSCISQSAPQSKDFGACPDRASTDSAPLATALDAARRRAGAVREVSRRAIRGVRGGCCDAAPNPTKSIGLDNPTMRPRVLGMFCPF